VWLLSYFLETCLGQFDCPLIVSFDKIRTTRTYATAYTALVKEGSETYTCSE
jgi:hypothetical protein